MFEVPTGNQWQDLFRLAEQIRTRQPWRKYPEELIFTFVKENRNEPFYMTIHGFEEEVLGISVYQGKEDIKKYLNILTESDGLSMQTIIANQSCVSALFGEKDMLGVGDFTAMELAQFVPDRSADGHIYFRVYRPGFTPWYINSDQLNLLIMGLTAFLEADRIFGDQPFDPEKETVRYAENKGVITVVIAPFDESLKEKQPLVVKDDFYIARLKRLKKHGKCLEIDNCYMNTPVGSGLGPVPFFPKLCIIADTDQGYIADQCIFEEGANEEEAFFEFIAKYFNENGLPRKINIRGAELYRLLSDLCDRLNIDLKESRQLAIIDDFLAMVGSFSPEE
ncbi:MAG TPA: hypothetical protein PKD52_02035 [Clostridiales bacterium]|nr:hypothetical protein [Clostridiales bacterium]